MNEWVELGRDQFGKLLAEGVSEAPVCVLPTVLQTLQKQIEGL